MAVKLAVIEDAGVRTVGLTVEGVPDVPVELTTLSTPIRPTGMEIRYGVISGAWHVVQITVSGRPVLRDGTVSMMNNRRVNARFMAFGAEGEGKTPRWVLDFAAKYSNPDDLPRKK